MVLLFFSLLKEMTKRMIVYIYIRHKELAFYFFSFVLLLGPKSTGLKLLFPSLTFRALSCFLNVTLRPGLCGS